MSGAGRILVTGEDALAEAAIAGLRATSAQVRWLRAQASPSPGPGIDVVSGDLGRRFSIPSLLAGCDRVLHLDLREDLGDVSRDLLYAINLENTGHLLSAAREAGVARFVLRSSLFARGSAPEDPGMPVVWDLGEVQLPAIQSLRLSELEALRQGGLGLPLVLWTPTFLVGPGARGPVADRVAEAALGRVPLMFGTPVEPVTVEAAARAAVEACLEDTPPLRILTRGPASRLDRLCADAARTAGHRAPASIPAAAAVPLSDAMRALGSRRRAGLMALAARRWTYEGVDWSAEAQGRRPR